MKRRLSGMQRFTHASRSDEPHFSVSTAAPKLEKAIIEVATDKSRAPKSVNAYEVGMKQGVDSGVGAREGSLPGRDTRAKGTREIPGDREAVSSMLHLFSCTCTNSRSTETYVERDALSCQPTSQWYGRQFVRSLTGR